MGDYEPRPCATCGDETNPAGPNRGMCACCYSPQANQDAEDGLDGYDYAGDDY